MAAFDHRHIFLDPDPDAATSFAERRRLFDLPRSSWDDYDASLISAGGGVLPRTAKSIPITPQVRGRARHPDAGHRAEPGRADAGDPAGPGRPAVERRHRHLRQGRPPSRTPTSATRPTTPSGSTAAQLRAKVVGEGGNLGLTQRGRIEYARSAPASRQAHLHRLHRQLGRRGLLRPRGQHQDPARARSTDGALTRADRDELLAAMTDEVAELVLRDNYEQATALGNARAQAHSLLPVHRRLITELERSGQLDRALEALPTDEELAARGDGRRRADRAGVRRAAGLREDRPRTTRSSPRPARRGRGPSEVLARLLPDARCGSASRRGWPRTGCAARSSPPRWSTRSSTGAASSFVFRAIEETGATAADVIRAFVVVRDVFGLPRLWRAVEALDNQVADRARRPRLYLEARRLLDRAVRWLVTNRRSPIDVAGEIDHGCARRGGAAAPAGRAVPRPGTRLADAHAAELVAAGRPR